MVEQANPALEHVVTKPIAEEAVVCSHTRAAAHTIVNTVGDAALLVPAVGESHAVTISMLGPLQQQ